MMHNLSRNKNAKKYFFPALLPKPLTFYQKIFTHLKLNGKWAMVLCCFHDDHHPSLSLNLEIGSFRCFACGESGGDIIDFYQRFHRVNFKTAVQALGAWRNLYE